MPAAVGGWVLRTYVFPARFEPVALSEREEAVLGAKLRRIGIESMQVREGELRLVLKE